MAFTFRHFKQILEDWIGYVTGHSTLTDINPGSIVRTIGEATALEVAQVYVQLQSILNLFSIDKASGEDLDERALDFDLTRLQPSKSSGVVTIGDSELTSADIAVSTLAAPLVTGVSTFAQIQSGDYASWPSSGVVIVDRNGTTRESIIYTSKTSPDKLNFAGGTFPLYDHSISETTLLSTVGFDRPVPAGSIVKTEAPENYQFEITEDQILYDGDYQITNVPIQSLETGAVMDVAAGRIVLFGSPPFPTATVVNNDKLTGGLDYETDEDFRARIKETQQSLSSSTVARIESEALKVQLPATGQRVVTAKVIEPIVPGESILYINDGTSSYSPSTISVNASEFLIPIAEAGQRRAQFDFWPLVIGSLQVFVSLERGYTSAVGVDSLTDNTKAWTLNEWAGFRVKDENSVIFVIVSNTADTLTLTGGGTPQIGAYAIFDPSATAFPTGSKLTQNVDYIANETIGQIELTSTSFPTGLVYRDCLLAYYDGINPSYTYYDGLLREVQRVISGDATDIVTYPGTMAAGTKVSISAASIVTVIIELTLAANPGIDESTIRPAVKTAILNYINNLSIGEDVLRSRIIEAAMGVTGVFDVALITPTTNVVITDSQLAKTTLANISVT